MPLRWSGKPRVGTTWASYRQAHAPGGIAWAWNPAGPHPTHPMRQIVDGQEVLLRRNRRTFTAAVGPGATAGSFSVPISRAALLWETQIVFHPLVVVESGPAAPASVWQGRWGWGRLTVQGHTVRTRFQYARHTYAVTVRGWRPAGRWALVIARRLAALQRRARAISLLCTGAPFPAQPC